MRFTNTFSIKKICVASVFAAIFLFAPAEHVFALTLTPIRLELTADPGSVLTENITLINERKTTETFYVSFENFEAQGETGNPTWITPEDDLGTWMKSQDSVILLPGEQKNVSFTIEVPKNAEPGGHFAGIFWGTTPSIQQGGQVAIGAKTGVLVLLSVSGPTSEKGGILEFSTKDQKKFFTALPIDFYYRFQNSGSDRIKPTGDLVIKNIIGLTASQSSGNPIQGNILPKSIRKIEVAWKSKNGSDSATLNASGNFFQQAKYQWHNFALGHYRANLNLTYGTSHEAAHSVYSFWVFPWQLVVLSIVILLVAFMLIRTALRRYNRWVIGRAEQMFEEREAQMHHIQKKTVLHKAVGPKIKKK